MNLFKRLFNRPAPVRVIDVATFGPRLGFTELETMIKANPEVVRAVAQVGLFLRERCQRAVEDKSNIAHGQTAFESGGAAGMTDYITTLEMIRQGKAARDGQLREWFVEPNATK